MTNRKVVRTKRGGFTVTPVRPESKGRGLRVTSEQKRVYWERRDAGYSILASSKLANFSHSTAHRIERSERMFHEEALAVANAPDPPSPRSRTQLNPEAKKALTTFAYFQRRYFGRIAIGWQIEAAEKMVEWLETPTEEFAVINVCPGSGKSTTFTLDFSSWATCRNRAIRGQIGSLTMRQAQLYVARLRRAFERTVPQKAALNTLRLELAVDAESTMAMDYGRFQPTDRDLWSRDQFIVMQTSGVAISEKEPTWSAFGKDSAFLGGRYDLVIWDDLTDPTKIKTATARDELKSWYGDIAESRLEPGGLMVLQGQRTGADDIYRYALDLDTIEFDDTGEEVEGTEAKKYHHIVFRAHYETRCKGAETHKLGAPPYPKGCLIYPRRLPWPKLATLMANRDDRFRVLYQQEDSDPAETLVLPEWIYGTDGSPGCIDKTRSLGEVPHGIAPSLSVVTCDPSPSNKWGVIWWLVEPTTDTRHVIDIFNGKMDAPDLLDFHQATHSYIGLMADWQKRSMDLGIPITHWVVEINAAQRFLLQYEHVRRWMDLSRVQIIQHTTSRNKTDADYGVETIAPGFQYGRYRLPYNGDETRWKVQAYIHELTRYGHMRTDDLVMATWFLDWNLPNIRPKRRLFKRSPRPSWLLAEATR